MPSTEPLVVTNPVNDHFTISGPPAKLNVTGTQFTVISPTAIDHGDGTFTVSSE